MVVSENRCIRPLSEDVWYTVLNKYHKIWLMYKNIFMNEWRDWYECQFLFVSERYDTRWLFQNFFEYSLPLTVWSNTDYAPILTMPRPDLARGWRWVVSRATWSRYPPLPVDRTWPSCGRVTWLGYPPPPLRTRPDLARIGGGGWGSLVRVGSAWSEYSPLEVPDLASRGGEFWGGDWLNFNLLITVFPDFSLTHLKFPDFSLTFWQFFKIPWLFPDWKKLSHFSRFSRSVGTLQ